MVTVTRLNTTPSRPRVELWRNFRVKLEAHLEQSRSPWHQRVTRMIEGRGQTLSDLNHHEATGTRKEVIRQPLSPRFGCCGLSSVGYRRTSAAIRARGLHAPTAPKFMDYPCRRRTETIEAGTRSGQELHSVVTGAAAMRT